MKVVIYHNVMKSYASGDANSPWVKKLEEAQKFNSEAKARNWVRTSRTARSDTFFLEYIELPEEKEELENTLDDAAAATLTTQISSIVNVLKSITLEQLPSLIAYYRNKIEERDWITVDICHRLELEESTMFDMIFLANELKRNQQERRVCKDALYWAELMYTLNIPALCSNIAEKNKKLEERTYNPRGLGKIFNERHKEV